MREREREREKRESKQNQNIAIYTMVAFSYLMTLLMHIVVY